MPSAFRGDSLLERSSELSAIHHLTAAVASGDGTALFVHGPAGIGKTSLLAAARDQAHRLKLRVLKARGSLFEREYPFGAIRQLLDPVIGDPGLRATVLADPAAAAASVFDADPDVQSPDMTFAVTYGLFWAFMNLSALSPILLTVDDLQWVDGPSLRTLDFVLRRIEDAPIGAVLAVRSGEEIGQPDIGTLGELETAGFVTGIEPEPLSPSAAQILAQRAFENPVDPRFAHACHARTAGNPLFLTELLRALAGDAVPPSLASVPIVERALAEPPSSEQRPSVLFGLGAAEAAMRQPSAGIHLGDALELAPPGPMRAQIALLLARLLTFAGLTSQVRATVALGRAGLDSADQDLLLALDAVSLTADGLTPSGPGLTSDALARYSTLTGATPGERAVLACVAFTLSRSSSPLPAVREVTDRALAHGGGDLLAGSDPFTALMLNVVLEWIGDLGRAISLGTSALEAARSINSSMLYTEALASRAFAHWASGNLDAAEADARLSFETEGMISGTRSPVAVATLARVLVDRGEPEAAHALAAGYELSSEREDLMVREFIVTALGRAELAMGRYEEALAHFKEAGEIASGSGVVNPAVSEWRLLAAQALRGLGRHDTAWEMLEPALLHARRSGGPIELGGSLRVAALIETPVNISRLEEAISVLEKSELRLEHARALIDLGAALRRSGARTSSREPLVQGMDIAQQCGANALVEHAMSELRASGARPRRVERSGIAALTPTERRVAGLAAAGLSNREIAQELFVSTRTIETHLRSTFEKLDVHSRQELGPLFKGDGAG